MNIETVSVGCKAGNVFLTVYFEITEHSKQFTRKCIMCVSYFEVQVVARRWGRRSSSTSSTVAVVVVAVCCSLGSSIGYGSTCPTGVVVVR